MRILCVVIGIIGGCYAIFGGLKAVAVSDTINGIGLIIGGLMIPFLALALLGHETTGGGLVEGVKLPRTSRTRKAQRMGFVGCC